MSGEEGSAFDTLVWNGPSMPKKYVPTQMTIQFNMIVVMTSCAPTVPFKMPAMPAMAAPPSIPARMAMTMRSQPGMLAGSCVATRTAAMEPARYWPWPPMLKSPHRNANATASPVSTSATHRISVCWRFDAAIDWMSSVFQGNHTCVSVNGMPTSWLPTSKNHESPEPRTIAR